MPAREAWFTCLRQQTELLAASAPPDCWISPTILRGPSDVLAALRGLTGFLCDLRDAPQVIAQAAGRIHQLLIRAIDEHFSVVKPKYGGYGHIFGYWAPGPTIALQEDALGLCHPRPLPGPLHALHGRGGAASRTLRGLPLHSTGFQHFRHVLRIPGLAGLQVTIEANGPSLADLLPVFREILGQSRLLLFLDHRFEELSAVLPQLPREGLYLAIPARCLENEAAFLQFTKTHWRTDA